MNHAVERTWNYWLNIFDELDFSYPSIMNLLSNTFDIMKVLSWDIFLVFTSVSKVVFNFAILVFRNFLFKNLMYLLFDLSNMTCKNVIIHWLSFIFSLHVPETGMPVSFFELINMSNSKIIAYYNKFKVFFFWKIIIST